MVCNTRYVLCLPCHTGSVCAPLFCFVTSSKDLRQFLCSMRKVDYLFIVIPALGQGEFDVIYFVSHSMDTVSS